MDVSDQWDYKPTFIFPVEKSAFFSCGPRFLAGRPVAPQSVATAAFRHAAVGVVGTQSIP